MVKGVSECGDFKSATLIKTMVLILGGNSKHDGTHEEKEVFSQKKKIRFVTALDLIKCQRLLLS